jgi:hypothetical protein
MSMRFEIDVCGDNHCYCDDAFIEKTSLPGRSGAESTGGDGLGGAGGGESR